MSLKCFEKECAAIGSPNRVALGVRAVPLDRIVGSVGRCRELTSEFLPKSATPAKRRGMRKAMEKDQLPPVDLYKLGDDYYILDGHHRVAVAKELGKLYIDANVVEFSLSEDGAELVRQRHHFEGQTGLSGIAATELGRYEGLLREILEYGERLGRWPSNEIKALAREWKERVFEPAVAKLEEVGLPALFPGRSPADLYAHLMDHRRTASQLQGEDVGIDGAVRDFQGVHGSRGPVEAMAGQVSDWAETLGRKINCRFLLLTRGGDGRCGRPGRLKGEGNGEDTGRQ